VELLSILAELAACLCGELRSGEAVSFTGGVYPLAVILKSETTACTPF